VRFAEQMREEGYELMRAPAGVAIDPWLAETLQEAASLWLEVPDAAPPGRSIAELAVRKRTGASIVAVRRRGVIHTNPKPDFQIEPGDSLLVLPGPQGSAPLEALLAGPGPG